MEVALHRETPKRSQKKTECAKFRAALTYYDEDSRPLYLYSFRVYLAYNNLWYYINRDLITKDEYDVMRRLGCYKYPQRYLGRCE